MDFQVNCACGNQMTVNEGSAGATKLCSCGSRVSVPSLATLRADAGLPPYDPGPVLLIQHLLSTGRLPGTTLCVACGQETAHVVDVRAECETSYRTESNDRSKAMLACLSLFFWPVVFLVSRKREVTEHGRDTVLCLPLPACENCRSRLRKRKTLKQALQKIPLYGELLGKFPNAKLSLVADTRKA